MVRKEITFKDGTRIFYEEINGRVQRFIEYALSPMEKEKIRKEIISELLFETNVNKYNAGKYYYLSILQNTVLKLNESQKIQLYNDLKNLHDRTSAEYDTNIVNKSFLDTFGKYWPNNNYQCACFFTLIYLAMVDMEQGKSIYPNSMGKTMVLKSCEAIILRGANYEDAAKMYERKHNDVIDNDRIGYFDVDDYPYEKYHGYNGYDDETIDTAFDGYPEATWNVD